MRITERVWSNLPARLALPLTACAALSFGGCHSPGGMGYSADMYTYDSTEWRPYTISIVDTTTGETVWTVDVPVGQQLAMGFRKGVGPNHYRPDMMDWELEESGRLFGTRSNQVPVPGSAARRVDVDIRAVPEKPPIAPPPRGTPATAASADR